MHLKSREPLHVDNRGSVYNTIVIRLKEKACQERYDPFAFSELRFWRGIQQ